MRNQHGDPMEFESYTACVRHLAREHGYRPGDVHRTYLPRYEGRAGSYAVPAWVFP